MGRALLKAQCTHQDSTLSATHVCYIRRRRVGCAYEVRVTATFLDGHCTMSTHFRVARGSSYITATERTRCYGSVVRIGPLSVLRCQHALRSIMPSYLVKNAHSVLVELGFCMVQSGSRFIYHCM